MIDALIQGRIYKAATQRTAKSGNAFATCSIRTGTGEGGLFVSCIAFAPEAVTALLALEPGDAVAVAGEATPRVWTAPDGTAKPSLDVQVQRVLTAYHVTRKRAAVSEVAQ